MRVGIDARFLTHPQMGGFKSYTMNLVSALAKNDRDNAYVLYLDRAAGSDVLFPAASNFTCRVVEGRAPLVGMFWREQVRLAQEVRRDCLDLFHSPCLTAPLFLSCPSVVTTHDTIWRSPRKYAGQRPVSVRRGLLEWYYRFAPELAARRAAVIITISQSAKNDIARELGVPADRLRVTYPGIGPVFQRVTDPGRIEPVCRKYQIPGDFVLALGSADPRKNIPALIQAYGLLPEGVRSHYGLVIVWNHSSMIGEAAQQVERLGLAGRVRFISHVSNAELAGLYSIAALFVFPSLYEGFGLPPLEAMACGAPVVAADNSSIPEVVGDAALMVRAEDVPGMARTMTAALQNPALRMELSEKGLRRARNFSWEKCAAETVIAYQQAADATRNRRSFLSQKNCA